MTPAYGRPSIGIGMPSEAKDDGVLLMANFFGDSPGGIPIQRDNALLDCVDGLLLNCKSRARPVC